MPRQIHVTVTEEQQSRCWEIAQQQTEPTTWQEIARKMIDSGLDFAEHLDAVLDPSRTERKTNLTGSTVSTTIVVCDREKRGRKKQRGTKR